MQQVEPRNNKETTINEQLTLPSSNVSIGRDTWERSLKIIIIAFWLSHAQGHTRTEAHTYKRSLLAAVCTNPSDPGLWGNRVDNNAPPKCCTTMKRQQWIISIDDLNVSRRWLRDGRRDCRCYGDSAISTLCPVRGCTCARSLSQYCVWPFPSPAVATRHDSSLTNRVIEVGGVVLRWPELGQDKTEGRPSAGLFIQSILEGCC